MYISRSILNLNDIIPVSYLNDHHHHGVVLSGTLRLMAENYRVGSLQGVY